MVIAGTQIDNPYDTNGNGNDNGNGNNNNNNNNNNNGDNNNNNGNSDNNNNNNGNSDNNNNNNNGGFNGGFGYNSNTNNDNNNDNSNSHKQVPDHCHDISSKDNTIFGNSLCGNLVSKYDSEYDETRQQYSTLNEYGNIRTLPNYIITADPRCDMKDNDIKLTLKYAKECNYKISIRSGGHQYNGLSSCQFLDQKCIQIDMQLYDNINIIDTNIKFDTNYNNNNDDNGKTAGYGYGGYGNGNNNNNNDKDYKDYKYTIIESGPGISADKLWTFLKTNDIFFPTNARAALGAQIVQGGSGSLLRFGTASDYVIGFDIILADGYEYMIKNPEVDYFSDNGNNNGYSSKNTKSYKNNDELYAAVLGGGPGSFGIVTNIYLKAFNNDDFGENIYWKLEWDYSPKVFEKVGYQFVDLLNSDYYRNDMNKYIGLDITDEYITYYGWWIKINDDKKYKFNQNIIEDFRNIGDARVIVPLPYKSNGMNDYNNGNGMNDNNNDNGADYNYNGAYNTITYNYVNYIVKDIDYWQFEQPMLNQKQYSNNNLNYDIIDIINDKIKYINENPMLGIRLDPGSLRITDEYSENSLSVKENYDATAQQNRQTMFAIFMETLQYDYSMNKYSRDHAIEWMDDLFKMLMKNNAFDGYDIRNIGYTNSFDKFDMEKEWEYYFENEKEYNKVRDAKTYVDQYELFNGNDFIISAFEESKDNGNNYKSY